MNAKIKKIVRLSYMMSIMCVLAFGSRVIAQASTISNKDVHTLFSVPNATHKFQDGKKVVEKTMTNIGGISAGTAHNRLFAVKSFCKDGDAKSEEYGVLYYYSNIYDNKVKNNPKKIFFKNGLLGHANSMTVDDENIYISRWKKSNNNTRYSILQISRDFIYNYSSNNAVSKLGNEIKSYTVKYEDGADYNQNITQIAKYSYDSKKKETKFVISLNKPSESVCRYTIATLRNGRFTVSRNNYIQISTGLGNGYVSQDIFYDSAYGLYMLFWNKNSGTSNVILRCNIDNMFNKPQNQRTNIIPSKSISITGNKKVYNKRSSVPSVDRNKTIAH